MKDYIKPMVLVNEELTEGIYTASGDNSGGAAGTGVSVSGVRLDSEGHEYYKVNSYTVTVANSGSENMTDWKVNLSVASGHATNAQIYNSYQASASLSGDTITITPGEGGTIAAGSAIEIQLVVSYDSDFVEVR